MTNRKKIDSSTQKVLLLRSGGVCAKCKQQLTIKSEANSLFSPIAEFAHIYPYEENGPRHNDRKQIGLSPTCINSQENIIVLCPSCHTIIDKLPNDYPAEKLLKLKARHEKWVSDQLAQASLDISFSELDVICKAILSQSTSIPSDYRFDFSIIDINSKIKKNKLSSNVEHLIVTGLSRADFIQKYLNTQPDINFTPNLVNVFKNLYNLLSMQYEGDELYYKLLDKISPSYDFLKRSAANAVMSYLFHQCEIFEK